MFWKSIKNRTFLPRIGLVFVCFCLLWGCVQVDSDVPLQMRMAAEFSPEQADDLVALLELFGLEHSLVLEVFDNELAIVSSEGERTLYVELLRGDSSVMVLSSMGEPDTLQFMAVITGGITRAELERMASDLQQILEENLNLEFVHQMPPWTRKLK